VVGIFLADACAGGRRPAAGFGDMSRFDDDPAWHDALLFISSSASTAAWGSARRIRPVGVGLVADLVVRLSRARESRASS
jgi:hypothetical protein